MAFRANKQIHAVWLGFIENTATGPSKNVLFSLKRPCGDFCSATLVRQTIRGAKGELKRLFVVFCFHLIVK